MTRQKSKGNPWQGAYIDNALTTIIKDTEGTTATNVIRVTVTFKDDRGRAPSQRVQCLAFLSTDAEGDGIAATAPSSGVAVGSKGSLVEPISDKLFLLVTNASGVIELDITEAGVATFYLILCFPDGTIKASAAITFA